MGFILNGCHCSFRHNHGNSEEQVIKSGASLHGHSHMNMNVRAAFIHIIGDFLQSVGALIAAIIIYFKPDYKIADPICTFVFSIIVICTTLNILKDAFFILMEAFPKTIDYVSVKKSLEDIEGVKMVHSLHIWTLSLEKMVLSVHLAVVENINTDMILHKAEQLLRRSFGIYYTTIQIEKYDALTMTNCMVCQSP
ncbi:zinc transporter 2-like protein [Dinothrombium tinctorium]|uniref:Zinc transporter 2-like protein n=1 Tax=Dinothrombium tinctorium TaxID=1965070 RepID=A0A443QEH0_9ACAR|nr:zinc transporter 2-like protein [Dinothrombium tinctorium]